MYFDPSIYIYCAPYCFTGFFSRSETGQVRAMWLCRGLSQAWLLSAAKGVEKSKGIRKDPCLSHNENHGLKRTCTKHGPGSMDHLMDPVHGPPWTTLWTWSMDHSMDLVHGPGPMDQVPWTTPNFQKEIAPVNFIWKFTEGQGMKNKDSYLLLTFLRVCLVKASCFGIAAPWMRRPQTRFEIQKI